jgi:hypothetical protein
MFANIAPAICQGIPGCFPPSFPAVKPCVQPRHEPPISRTVQVDVPVPCGPVYCGQAMPCAPNPCGPPVCTPAPPTRPVQVRVDVRVRPEACGQQQPDQNVCRDYGALAPVLGMTAAIMAAPIRLLERMFPGPSLCRPHQPTCGPLMRLPYPGYQPVPPAKCIPSCPRPPIPVPAYQKCVPRAYVVGGRSR